MYFAFYLKLTQVYIYTTGAQGCVATLGYVGPGHHNHHQQPPPVLRRHHQTPPPLHHHCPPLHPGHDHGTFRLWPAQPRAEEWRLWGLRRQGKPTSLTIDKQKSADFQIYLYNLFGAGANIRCFDATFICFYVRPKPKLGVSLLRLFSHCITMTITMIMMLRAWWSTRCCTILESATNRIVLIETRWWTSTGPTFPLTRWWWGWCPRQRWKDWIGTDLQPFSIPGQPALSSQLDHWHR